MLGWQRRWLGRFWMQAFRDNAGLIASVLLLALGIGLFFVSFPIVGTMLVLLGLALSIWQGIGLWKARQNRYDLKTLWDAPLPDREPLRYDETPDEDTVDDPDAMAYCHICGHAVPLDYSRCPDCGNPL